MKTSEAYQKFINENPQTFDSTTLGCDAKMNEFLSNRLWNAFMSGHAAGELETKERIKDRFDALILTQ